MDTVRVGGQTLGELPDTVGQAPDMMKEHDISHALQLLASHRPSPARPGRPRTADLREPGIARFQARIRELV